MRERSKLMVTPFVLLAVLTVSMPAVLHSYFGYAIRIIRTGSMEPTLQPGDAVFVRAVPATSLVEGDIALLFHPKDGEIEAHRILTADETESGIEFVTKGDANPMSDDAILVPTRAGVERMLLPLPKVGYFVTIFGSPQVLGSVCALGLMVLIAIEMQERRRRSVATSQSITQ